ncbi:MAG: dienelactone hydrolase family protein [Oligoflexus sp.]|nr:dienelactone hydrolase family protein [Oligoflexus sp.]
MLLKKSIGILTTAALLLGSSAMAAVNSKKIIYKKGPESFEGVLYTPDSVRGKAPGILMVANWMGLTDETKAQAERFANLGYVVFTADIYGKGKNPKSMDEAGKLAGKYKGDRKLFREHLVLGLDELKKQTNVDTSKLAAVGYCFGGTGVIELARTGADLKGVMSFHGGLDSPTPADGKNIKAHVIAFHGADDPYNKPEDVAAFEKEMRDSKVDWQLVKFGNAVHSFTEKAAGTDNSKGAAYNEKADQRSFTDAEQFLKETL